MASQRDPWVNWLDFPVIVSAGYYRAKYQECRRVMERQGPFLFAIFDPAKWFSSLHSLSPSPRALFLLLSFCSSFISCLATQTFLLYSRPPVPSPLVCCWTPPVSSVLMKPGPRRHVPLVSGIALLVNVWTFCPLWRGIRPCESVLRKSVLLVRSLLRSFGEGLVDLLKIYY